MLTSCVQKQHKSVSTWLYGYGQVERLNGRVKQLTENGWGYSRTSPYFITTFDNKGCVISIQDVWSGSISKTHYLTVYDKNNRKIESIGIYKDEGKDIKEIYKYDANEYLTRCIDNANNPSTDTDRYLYDNTGNVIEHQQYFEKKLLWIFKYKYLYNKRNICTGVEQSMTTWRDNFKTPALDTTKYIRFDSNNNWVKAINFLNDTITRKITYYQP